MKKYRTMLIALSQLIFLGCATPAWNKYPVSVPPDYSCSSRGGEAGTYYYIWKCLNGKRVVIKQTSTIFTGLLDADKYESTCEGKTEIESNKILDPESKECKAQLDWKTDSQSPK